MFRFIKRIPDATPALLWSTAFIAAVLIGDMARAMPMPMHEAGKRKPKPVVGPAQVPIALPRSCGGKVFVMIESVAGIMSAAPTPCSARPPMSHADVCEQPMKSLEAANSTTPVKSGSRPAATARAARRAP